MREEALCPVMSFRRIDDDPFRECTRCCAWYDKKNDCCYIVTKCKEKENKK